MGYDQYTVKLNLTLTIAVEPTLPTQKLQAKPHNVKERRYDKGPMNQEKTAMKAKRTTK